MANQKMRSFTGADYDSICTDVNGFLGRQDLGGGKIVTRECVEFQTVYDGANYFVIVLYVEK